MDLLLRVSGTALCTLLFCLLLRRTNPELAAGLGMAAVIVILLAALGFGAGFRELVSLLKESFGLSDTYIRPVLKCVAAAIVTRLTADLCRDASQTAAAAAVELAGTVCALGVLMPLLLTMLKTLEGFL